MNTETALTRSKHHAPVKEIPEYHSWRSMRARCYDPNNASYYRYGARGVVVHEEWRKSFKSFFEDVGPRPSKGHTLDRFPNHSGNYEPGNVRWATQIEQNRNRANTPRMPDGESLADFCERTGLKYKTLIHYLTRASKPFDEAVALCKKQTTRLSNANR